MSVLVFPTFTRFNVTDELSPELNGIPICVHWGKSVLVDRGLAKFCANVDPSAPFTIIPALGVSVVVLSKLDTHAVKI